MDEKNTINSKDVYIFKLGNKMKTEDLAKLREDIKQQIEEGLVIFDGCLEYIGDTRIDEKCKNDGQIYFITKMPQTEEVKKASPWSWPCFLWFVAGVLMVASTIIFRL